MITYSDDICTSFKGLTHAYTVYQHSIYCLQGFNKNYVILRLFSYILLSCVLLAHKGGTYAHVVLAASYTQLGCNAQATQLT